MAKRNVEATAERVEWTKANCKHKIIGSGLKMQMAAGVSWRYPEADPVVEGEKCLACGILMPLGKALDTHEALMEHRAAEIAASEINRLDLVDEEALGFVENLANIDAFIEGYGPKEWTGWLAAEIFSHDLRNPEQSSLATVDNPGKDAQ